MRVHKMDAHDFNRERMSPMDSSNTVSTPVPAKIHAQVKAYAALNNMRVPRAYEVLITLALEIGQKQ